MVTPRRLIALILICGLAGPAHAHLLNMSKASISLASDGAVAVELALDLLISAGSREAYYDLSLRRDPLADPEVQALLATLPEALDLRINEQAVSLELTSLRFDEATREEYLDPLSWPRAELRLSGRLPVAAANGAVLQMRYTEAFRFEEPIASTFIDTVSGRKQTRWLVTGQQSPRFVLQRSATAAPGKLPDPLPTAAEAPGEAFAAFRNLLSAGFRHIFPEGIDHLLFVAALFFGSASLPALVGVITVFTLAHSLSLGLTALGWFSVPPTIVEPLILLSILWVSLGNLLKNGSRSVGGKTPSRAPYAMVLIFGLVHGLGFAAALRDIGLPSDYLLTGLLAFNLGVEAAQLTFLFALAAVSAALLLIATRLGLGNRAALGRGGSALVALLTLTLIVARFA